MKIVIANFYKLLQEETLLLSLTQFLVAKVLTKRFKSFILWHKSHHECVRCSDENFIKCVHVYVIKALFLRRLAIHQAHTFVSQEPDGATKLNLASLPLPMAGELSVSRKSEPQADGYCL